MLATAAGALFVRTDQRSQDGRESLVASHCRAVIRLVGERDKGFRVCNPPRLSSLGATRVAGSQKSGRPESSPPLLPLSRTLVPSLLLPLVVSLWSSLWMLCGRTFGPISD